MVFSSRNILFRPLAAVAGVGLVCALCQPCMAYGVTSAEMQAEADALFAQIDELQTSLNEANDAYDSAKSEYESATKKVEESQKVIEEQCEKIETLQESLGEYAVQMYKNEDSLTTFMGVVLESQSFEEFATAVDYMQSVSHRGSSLVAETKSAREKTEQAKATYEEQSQLAKESMETAEQKAQEIEALQSDLRAEAEKVTQEVAELKAVEEAEAEAARKAAEEAAAAQASAAAAETGYVQPAESSASASDGGSGDSSGTTDAGTTESAPVVSGTGAMANPCPGGSISSTFGYRDFDSSFHMGLDLAAAEGTPYYAADSGTVIYATNDGSYNGGAGNWIVISHGNGLVTKYMHSSAVYVNVGDSVSKGQNIGAVGNTGNSFGAHLHFQVELNGAAVDPLGYI